MSDKGTPPASRDSARRVTSDASDTTAPYGSPPPRPDTVRLRDRRGFWPSVVGAIALLVGVAIGAGGEPSDDQVTASPQYVALAAERDQAAAELLAATTALDEAESREKALADREDELADLEGDLDAATQAQHDRETEIADRESAVADREDAVQDREDAADEAEAEAEAEDRGHAVDPPADSLDPRFGTCREALANGYGHYVIGVDPEYEWYRDADSDGVVCE